MCGCGQKTPIADITKRERGQYRGYPMKFIDGHRVKSRVTLVCTYCGTTFQRKPGQIKKGARPFCSFACLEKSKKRFPVLQCDGTAKIPLTKGMHAIIDAQDVERVSQFTWYAAHSSGGVHYAKAHMKDGRNEYLHRFLLDLPDVEVDHVDGDPLNNRRSNLRLATSSENKANRRADQGRTLPKGVYLTHTGRYEAKLQKGDLRVFIGVFDSPEDAARAYDEAAILHFGEFARLNFPD